jgi:hypothetical protein
MIMPTSTPEVFWANSVVDSERRLHNLTNTPYQVKHNQLQV